MAVSGTDTFGLHDAWDDVSVRTKKAVRTAKRSAQSKSGKGRLQKRGMHLERTFAHILDAGGARRTTLRGLANLNKRYKIAAIIYNLSQLMRKLFGVGTPKQRAAGARTLFCWLWTCLLTGWARTVTGATPPVARLTYRWQQSRPLLPGRIRDRARVFRDASLYDFGNWRISTGC